MKPTIIGLVGPSGSGKTTVYRYLRERYGFMRIHAVANLKHGLAQMLEVPPQWLEAPEIDVHRERFGTSLRPIAEHVGSTIHDIAPHVWPALLAGRVSNIVHHNPDIRLFVDGIRRSSEAAVVREYGGKIIRVEGKPDPKKPCDRSQAEVEHDYLLRWAPTADERHNGIDDVLRDMGLGDALRAPVL